MDSVIIIGAGQAGVQAVASLRAEGFTGAITLLGDEPFPPYQRPPLSKAYLSGDFVRERLFLKPESFYAESRCELRLSAFVTDIDRHKKTVSLAGGETLSYDRLLFATGARVRKLTAPGADLPGIQYLRGIEDVDALRPLLKQGARLAVVGGGYIGLEVAAVAAKHGLQVTVVEAASRLMVRAVSPAVSAFYEREHLAHGVTLKLEAVAESFLGKDRVEAVATNKGLVEADIALVGIGVIPNSELAFDTGLSCLDGIVVDEFGATEDPDIFAAGDCTNHPGFTGARIRLESVQNAIDQTKHAVLAMLGRKTRYSEVPWFWSDQYDLKLQIAGLTQPGDATVLRGDPVTRKFSVFHLREGVVAAVEAVNAAPDYIVGRKLIAARAVIAPERLADMAQPIKTLV